MTIIKVEPCQWKSGLFPPHVHISISPHLQSSAQKELEESWQVYAELQRMVEQSQAELVEAIATKQREAERHAQELARGLENELSQLKRRSNELEAHAQMQDRVLFLQVLTSNLTLGHGGGYSSGP